MNDWIGPPRVTALSVGEIDITDYFYPDCHGPLFIQIEDCEDFFCPAFSTKEKIREFLDHLSKKMCVSEETLREVVEIVHIKEPMKFCELVWSFDKIKTRIMLDPDELNDHHIRWTELFKTDKEARQAAADLN